MGKAQVLIFIPRPFDWCFISLMSYTVLDKFYDPSFHYQGVILCLRAKRKEKKKPKRKREILSVSALSAVASNGIIISALVNRVRSTRPRMCEGFSHPPMQSSTFSSLFLLHMYFLLSFLSYPSLPRAQEWPAVWIS